MKKFIVFKNGTFVDVEKIVCVRAWNRGSRVYYDLVGCSYDEGAFFDVEESASEVRALIQKALGNEVSFTSSK